MSNTWAERVASITPQVTGWYQHLHQYPEPSFQEVATTQYIREQLEKMDGVTVRQVTPTGVVADIQGGKSGKKVGLRADIDALVMPEEADVPYKSKNEGVMHGCGHDAHTAMLLGATHILSQYRQELPGSYRIFFQPAEENPPGGAIDFVKAGELDDVDYIIGQHVLPLLPTGTFGLLDGAIMAASDTIYIDITGKGGHASMPHLNIDVITCGSAIVEALQTIVSREVPALEQLVISITNFHAGTSHNVMAQTASLTGTVRTYDESIRTFAQQRIQEVARLVGEAHRCQVTVRYERGYNATINDAATTQRVRESLRRCYGDDALPMIQPLMGGEDFSEYLAKVPGTFYFLGIGNEAKGIVHPLHHNCFRVDMDALPIGVGGLLIGAITLAQP